jgi:hypothetical protein
MLMLESSTGKEPFITRSCRGLSVGIETESYNPRERIMKKVLLTTTALVMTAGVAADNGLTMSTSFDMGAGELVDYNDDDKREAQSDALGAPELTIGFMGYTFSAQQDGVDNLYNGDLPGADLGVSGSMGNVTFAVTGDIDDDNTSYKLGYTAGDLTVTVTGTNDENGRETTTAGVTTGTGKASASAISASYKMGDLTLTASTDNEGDADSTNKFGFSYKLDSITVAYTSIDPSAAGKDQGDEWDASIAYAAGALSASFAVDEADATTLIGEYDLGGGTTLFAAMHDKPAPAGGAADDNDMTTVGLNFKF